ncbi:MAG: preprotein translocase subunit SecG [Gammaproteobacteria bacterium]|nr:preprotein translocase subunit SecG [Gammaproteobacteria bacterium]HXK56956.1 preprotein translocase subunit SecG [Gammaproteobacteria bacterium]
MQTILVILHLFLALGLIGLVLMQHGKGADAGAAFGSGASGTVFGASGAANFLSRATAFLATLFFVTSLTLAWYAMQTTEQTGLMDTPQAAAPAPSKIEPNEVPVIPGQERSADSSTSPIPVIPESVPLPGQPKEVPKVAE